MSKTFQAILAEQDTEFTYFVKSIYNIHNPEVMDQIRLALLPYDLRSIETGVYKPIEKGNTDFPNVPNSPLYSVKVVVGLEPPEDDDAVQKVALFTRIKDEHIVVHKEGQDPHRPDNSDDVFVKGEYKPLTGTAKDFTGTLDDEYKDAQGEVADKRIGSLLKDLEAERKERKKAEREIRPKLKESFCTSHIALNQIENKWNKGFYVVEREAGSDSVMKISGPWKKQPTNFSFVPSLINEAVGELKVADDGNIIMEDFDRNFKYSYVSPRGQRKNLKETKFSVDVQDPDSGKSYNVVVDAKTDSQARNRAITMVANNNKLDSNNLIAANPDQA